MKDQIRIVIDEETKKKFKKFCEDRQSDMSKQLLKFINECIKEDKDG